MKWPLRPADAEEEARRRAVVLDRQRGTGVAVWYPVLALGVLLAAAGGGTFTPLSGWALAFVAAMVAFGLMPVPTGGRSSYVFGQPIIVLAGVLGGPVVGMLCGVAPNVSERATVWRRRATYAGLDGVQGVLAGWIGLAAWDQRIAFEQALITGCLLALAVSVIGRIVIQATRGGVYWPRLPFDTALEGTEFLLLAPIMLLSVQAGAEKPWLVLAAASSTVAIACTVWVAARHVDEQLRAERLRSQRDPLTGAPNRDALATALRREHLRVLNGDRAAAVFIVDLDHFKAINDTHRHQTGDAVLCHLVRRLTDSLRPGDLLARLGGEEFAIVCPHLDTLDAALDTAERLRLNIAGAPFPTRVGPLPVTISIGGTLLDGALTPDNTLDRADEALYQAKTERNRAVILPPITHAPATSTNGTTLTVHA